MSLDLRGELSPSVEEAAVLVLWTWSHANEWQKRDGNKQYHSEKMLLLVTWKDVTPAFLQHRGE